MNKKMWCPSPDRIEKSRVSQFIKSLEAKINDFEDLHKFSVNFPDRFWDAAWDFFGVLGYKGDIIYQSCEKFYQSGYFPKAKINFAQNMI